MSPARFGMSSAAQIDGTLAVRARRALVLSLRTFFLSLLLFTSMLGSGGFSLPYASAAGHPHAKPVPPSLTLQKFLHEGRPDHTYHGPFIRPLHPPLPPGWNRVAHQPSFAHLPPSAEPATMKPIRQVLDPTFLAGGTTAQPLDLTGSDKRLEVQISPGSFDLSHATTIKGSPVTGSVTLSLTQLYGHFPGEINLLGSYVLQLVDMQGQPLSGVQLRTPITYRYHYQHWELVLLNLDPNKLLLTWPVLIAAARQHHQPTTTFSLLLQHDATTHTLSGQSRVLGVFDMGGGDAQNQSPPTPHLASVAGNSGQLTYSYPLTLAPGPAGTVPALALSYSSESTNERHSVVSPAGSVGEGWSLSLGSISADRYTAQSAGGVQTWYSLNNVAGVSDRLVANPNDTTSFLTQHISQLKIRLVGSGNTACFHVWDTSGTYYEFGCTTDSLQFDKDSSGNQQNYRWDLDKVVLPNEGPGTPNKWISVTYFQDHIPTQGYTGSRDATIWQIFYGSGSTTVGTVDFKYLASFDYTDSHGTVFTQAYNTQAHYYDHCTGTQPPSTSTTLRCDDPIDHVNGNPAPAVISTMSLQSVTSYIGNDYGSNSHLAYSYAFQYSDSYYQQCWDDWTQIQQYCAGNHLLTGVTPTVYQNGTAHPLKGLSFTYTVLPSDYLDTTHTVPSQPSQYYHITPYWNYLTGYYNSDTGVGGKVSYQLAYSNTHGTPNTSDDNRVDPFYCAKHTDCTGSFAYPQDRAWAYQVVTQITSSGSDSSIIAAASTSYAYGLTVTIMPTPQNPHPCPGDSSGNYECVGDNWFPSGSTDFINYYQNEFRGFGNVYISSPAGDVTAQSYYTTAGWATPANSFFNYLGGSLTAEDVYSGNQTTGTRLRDTSNTYAGMSPGDHDSCNGNYSGLYTPCEVMVLKSRTTFYEGSSNPSPPWVERDDTFDDYRSATGLGDYDHGSYHNLTQEVISSSNAPTATRLWTYAKNDQTIGGWVYYDVNKVAHSELDDAASKVWQCQDISYDEGAPGNPPAPAQGLATTIKTYSDCANQSGTTITSYQGYDSNGSQVASVDGVATANSGFYGSGGSANQNGCTLASNPTVFPTTWGKTNYTTCTVYDPTTGLPAKGINAFSQASLISYDVNQGALPTATTDVNNQVTSMSYSYDSSGNRTVQVSQPGETNGYTSQSSTNSSCPATMPVSATLGPCFEIDSQNSTYTQAVTRTFYDSFGRAVETRTAGPDAAHDTVVFTVYDDAHHKVFQSIPFEVAHGSGWIDPAQAVDPGTNKPPTGTGIFSDALGRPLAMQDPAFGSPSVPGIACSATLSGNYTLCSNYGLGSVSGDNNTYLSATNIDPNNHEAVSFLDALGRTLYVQQDSGGGANGGSFTPNTQESIQYNVLGEPTQVKVDDLAPQTNQTVTSVTTTAQYDSLGRITQYADPDRGTHTLTYDADGRSLTDVSGSRTIGDNNDLLGRLGCVQDAVPTLNASGACTAGHALVQNTYDTDALGTQGSTDFPIGRLTKSVATTYYPGGSNVIAVEKMQYDQRGRLITGHLKFNNLPSSWNVTTPLPTYQVALSYNDANQLTTTITSTLNPSGSGYTTSQIYDPTTGVLSGLSNTTNTAQANLASLSYNSNALVNGITFLSSTGSSTLATEQLTYDGDLRLQEAQATWQSGSGNSGQIFDQTRSFDPASNVVSLTTTQASVPGQTNSGGSETQNFCYDEQNHLVWAGNSGTQPGAGHGTCGSAALSDTFSGAAYQNTFAYTHLGQLWKAPLNGSGGYKQDLYCDSSHPHQLTGVYPTGTTCPNPSGALYAPSYDAWGNVTGRTYSGSSATLSYDTLDHFVEWTNSGTNTQEWYAYDAAGQRVLRRSTSSGTTTLTVYAFGLEEHTYDGSGTSQSNTYYYRLGGQLVGELTGSPATTNFFLTDGLGSIMATFSNTASSAAVLGNQVYSPYGNQRYTKGSMGTAKGFTGQYNDATGLDYYNARYYDPVAGVFLSADTVEGNGVGMNPYGYVGGNPETWSDPTGHYIPCPDGGCGGGGGGSAGGGGMSGGGGGMSGGGGGSSGGGGSAWSWITGDVGTVEQAVQSVVQQLTDPETDPLLPVVVPIAAVTAPVWLAPVIAVAVIVGAAVVIGVTLGAIVTVATTTTLASGDLPPGSSASFAQAFQFTAQSSGGSPQPQSGGGGGQKPPGGGRPTAPPPPSEPEKQRMNPNNIRFTQRTCSNQGRGYTVRGNIEGLNDGSLSPDDLPPMRVFQKTAIMDGWEGTRGNRTGYGSNLIDGEWYTLDNRRLFAFQQAGITDIPVDVISNIREIQQQAWKFTTDNGGTDIELLGDTGC